MKSSRVAPTSVIAWSSRARAGVSGGGSDGNLTAAKGVATLDGLGVDGDGAHTKEEHLLYSSIEPGTRLMQGLFETLGDAASAT